MKSITNATHRPTFTFPLQPPPFPWESQPEIREQIQNFNFQFSDPGEHIQLSEIALQLQSLSEVTEEPQLLSKAKTGLNHSLLVFRDKENNLCIFIKSRSKNRYFLDRSTVHLEHQKSIMEAGGSKIIKKTGFLITLSPDCAQGTIRQHVSFSKSASHFFKDQQLAKAFGKAFQQEGLQEIHFRDEEKRLDRVIYIMPYLGERIDTEWHNLSDNKQKKRILLDLVQQVKTGKYNDIKSANTLLCVEQDKATCIDTLLPAFTYTPWGHEKWKGAYAPLVVQQEIDDAQEKWESIKQERENFIVIRGFLSQISIKRKIARFKDLKEKFDEIERHGTRVCNELSRMVFEYSIFFSDHLSRNFSIDVFLGHMSERIKYLDGYVLDMETRLATAPQATFEEARIFGLTVMIWELINPHYRHFHHTMSMYDAPKIDPRFFDEKLYSVLKIPPQKPLPAFSEALKLAYACRLSYADLETMIEHAFPG